MPPHLQEEESPLRRLLNNPNNQRGVALLMVLGSITFLSVLLAYFTSETQMNKLRIFNTQDRMQARLNAEAGLNFALARLRLYKEAYNTIEKNKQIDKKQIDSIDLIYSIPFIYPLSLPKEASIVERTAVEKFMKNSLIQGQIRVTIDNISHLINLNLLRIPEPPPPQSPPTSPMSSPFPPLPGTQGFPPGTPENPLPPTPDIPYPPNGPNGQNGKDPKTIENELTSLLKNAIDAKKEEDQAFKDRYRNLEVQTLMNELKYFVNSKKLTEQEQLNDRGEVENRFSAAKITPKFAPITSLSELYLLPSWNDDIIDLIKNEITAQGQVFLDLNNLTKNQLKMIIPSIDDEQTKKFFHYRDGNTETGEEEHKFEDLNDFKKYIVETASILTNEKFDEMIQDLKLSGIELGVRPTLFRIISTGQYHDTTLTITAIVSLPAKPQPRQSSMPNGGGTPIPPPPMPGPNGEDMGPPPFSPPQQPNSNNPNSKPPTELLEPKVLEISLS